MATGEGIWAVPTVIEIDVDARGVGAPSVAMVHGVASTLFDSDVQEHRAQNKLWTAWPAQDRSAGLLTLRYTWLADHLPLPATVTSTASSNIRFHRQDVDVKGLRMYHVSYGELKALAPRADTWMVRFHAPTFFSRDGTRYPLADPFLVMASLLQRWNAHASTPLQLRARPGDLARVVTLLAFDLRSQEWDGPKGQSRIGSMGSCLYRITEELPELVEDTRTLLNAAQYLSVGKETTYGFGVVTAEPVRAP